MIHLSLIILLPFAAAGIIRRQEEGNGTSATEPTFEPTAQPGSETDLVLPNDRGTLSLGLVIPLAVVLGTCIITAIAWAIRNQMREKTRRTVSVPMTADQLVGNGNDGSLSARRQRALQPGNSSGRGGRRAPGRYMRRTDSGESLKTLPEYSKDAGDAELVLVKHRPAKVEVCGMSADISEELGSSSPIPLPSPPNGSTTPVSNRSIPLSNFYDVSPAPTIHSAPVVTEPSTPLPPNRTTQRTWGDAPTYLEAMSSPDFSPTPSNSTPDSTQTIRTPRRVHQKPSFRTFLFRRPTPISLHPSSKDRLLGSPSPSPWTSTHSISSPIPTSAVRASVEVVEIPRNGLSDDQVRFLATPEAVLLVGRSVGAGRTEGDMNSRAGDIQGGPDNGEASDPIAEDGRPRIPQEGLQTRVQVPQHALPPSSRPSAESPSQIQIQVPAGGASPTAARPL